MHEVAKIASDSDAPSRFFQELVRNALSDPSATSR
jgi:hypothetical protein